MQDKITYLTVICIQSQNSIEMFATCAFIKGRFRLSNAISQVMHCV